MSRSRGGGGCAGEGGGGTDTCDYSVLASGRVESCAGIAEVMGSNPFKPHFFFTLKFHNCFNCVHTSAMTNNAFIRVLSVVTL